MGDVRTERGDLVPEKWEQWYLAAQLYDWMPARKNWSEVITELASWQARAEQAESTIAAWKKDAEDKDVLIAQLTRPQWISVEDRLPEDNQRVLVSRWNKQIEVQTYCVDVPQRWSILGTETGFFDDFELDTSVTHWMPLPEPPGAVHETKDGVVSRSTDLEREDGKK